MTRLNLIVTLSSVFAIYGLKTEIKKQSREFEQGPSTPLYEQQFTEIRRDIIKEKCYHERNISTNKNKLLTTTFSRNSKSTPQALSLLGNYELQYTDYFKDHERTLNKTTKIHSIHTHSKRVKSSKSLSRQRRDTYYCSKAGSCKNNIYKDIPVCYCDVVCNLLNDCCHDNTAKLAKTEDIPPDLKVKLLHTSCLIKIPMLMQQSRGYVFVSKCPANGTNLELTMLCQKREDRNSIPVTGDDGLAYMNKYCAMCHGVNVYQSWNLKYYFNCFIALNDLLHINNSNAMLELFEKNECPFHVFPPKGTQPRSCWDLQLNLDNARNKTLCMQFQNPIYTQNPKYGYIWERNEFCQNFLQESPFCAEALNSLEFGLSMRHMSALFEFKRQTESRSENCISGEKGSCNFEAVIGNAELDLHFRIITNGTYDLWKRILALSHSIIVYLLIPWQTKNPENVNAFCLNKSVESSIGFPCLNHSNCLTIDITLFMTINENVTLQDISQFYKSFKQKKWTYIERNGREASNYSISVFDFSTNAVIDPAIAVGYIGKEINRFLSILKHQLFRFKCAFMGTPKYLEIIGVYNNDQNVILNNEDSFKLQNLTCTLSETFEDVLNMTRKTTSVYWSTIQNVSTYVTMGLSSVFLLATVIIHRYLKLSMNTCGKVSEHFMISMLLSHLLFMFGFGYNDNLVICYVIGIISHYAWLSCFAWMTMYSALLLKAMLKLKENPNVSMATRFPIYNYIIGYGVPLLVVIPSVILDKLTGIKIGYASDVCFPSIYPTNIIVFIGPISFSLVVNAVAMMVAGYLIYKFQLSIENNSSLIDSRSYWPVYLRFFFFSGLSWSLGIIAEAADQDILRLLFIFLSGSHGFLFSVSILISKQVRNRLRSFKETIYMTRNSKF